MSSMIASKSGSRCERIGVVSDASTRLETGDGPGPSNRRSVVGSIAPILAGITGETSPGERAERLLDVVSGLVAGGEQRGAHRSTIMANLFHCSFQASDAVHGRHQLRNVRQPLLQCQRVAVSPAAYVVVQGDTRVGQDVGDGENRAGRAADQGGIDDRSPADEDAKPIRGESRELAEPLEVVAGFLHPGNIWMLREPGYDRQRQADAGDAG